MKNLNLAFYFMKALLDLSQMLLFILWRCNCLLFSWIGDLFQHLWTDINDDWGWRRAFSSAFLGSHLNRSFLFRFFLTFGTWSHVIFFLLNFIILLLGFTLRIVMEFLRILGWFFKSNRFLHLLCSIDNIEQNFVLLLKLFTFFSFFLKLACKHVEFFILFLFRNC